MGRRPLEATVPAVAIVAMMLGARSIAQPGQGLKLDVRRVPILRTAQVWGTLSEPFGTRIAIENNVGVIRVSPTRSTSQQ